MIQKIDIAILQFINNNLQNPILDKLMPIITSLGDSGMIWIIISFILILSKKYRKVGILSILALTLSTIIGEGILKNIIQRPRPFYELTNIQLLIEKPLSYSFPSGHTGSSFAVAGVIGTLIKKYKIPVITLAVLMAFSRIYLFVHYPTDIVGGIILGLSCSYIVTYRVVKSNKSCKSETSIL
jgi:undecaprenyl-diphosphatase